MQKRVFVLIRKDREERICGADWVKTVLRCIEIGTPHFRLRKKHLGITVRLLRVRLLRLCLTFFLPHRSWVSLVHYFCIKMSLSSQTAPQVKFWHTSWHVLLGVSSNVFFLYTPCWSHQFHTLAETSLRKTLSPPEKRNQQTELLITLSHSRRARPPDSVVHELRWNSRGGFFNSQELTSVKLLAVESVNHTRLLFLLCGWRF